MSRGDEIRDAMTRPLQAFRLDVQADLAPADISQLLLAMYQGITDALVVIADAIP